MNKCINNNNTNYSNITQNDTNIVTDSKMNLKRKGDKYLQYTNVSFILVAPEWHNREREEPHNYLPSYLLEMGKALYKD